MTNEPSYRVKSVLSSSTGPLVERRLHTEGRLGLTLLHGGLIQRWSPDTDVYDRHAPASEGFFYHLDPNPFPKDRNNDQGTEACVSALLVSSPERIKVSAAFPPVSEPVKAFPVFIHLVLSECHWNYHGHCLAFVCVYLCFPEIEWGPDVTLLC